jgi:acyl-ACP thioesterase
VADNPVEVLVPPPASGRTFTARRPVRFGDLSPGGRLRLDAIARYLQDVSSDDTTDAGLQDDLAWVVRKLVVEVHALPRFREPLTLTTWCSGIGSRWAERRVSLVGDGVGIGEGEGTGGAHVEAGVLWVHVDIDTGKPLPLAADFWDLYEEAAGGRKVGVRLSHAGEPPPDAIRSPWPLRFADFDLLGHVNNAAYWAAVEELLAGRRAVRPPFRAEIEYRTAIEQGATVEVATSEDPARDDGLDAWLVDGTGTPTYASMRVRAIGGAEGGQ